MFILEGVKIQVLGRVQHVQVDNTEGMRFVYHKDVQLPNCTLCGKLRDREKYRMCVSLSHGDTETMLAMCVDCYKLLDFGKQLVY